jgi:hypothetical protein
MEDKNNNLNKLIKFIGSDEFAEKQARLNLNYKKEGEEVVIIKDKDAPQNEKTDSESISINSQNNDLAENNKSGVKNLKKWLKYFIK